MFVLENEKLTYGGESLSPAYSSNGSWKTPISGKIQSEIQSNSSLIAAPNSSPIVQQIDANSRLNPASDEYPPPYPGTQQSTWPCDSFPNFNFENGMCSKQTESSSEYFFIFI